jgi:hypothetical protein
LQDLSFFQNYPPLFAILRLTPPVPYTHLCSYWVVFVVSTRFPILEASQQNVFFMGSGIKPHSEPPTWRTRVSLFVCAISLDLFGVRGPSSSYATASIAIRII